MVPAAAVAPRTPIPWFRYMPWASQRDRWIWFCRWFAEHKRLNTPYWQATQRVPFVPPRNY
jgi:hypothetical protein